MLEFTAADSYGKYVQADLVKRATTSNLDQVGSAITSGRVVRANHLSLSVALSKSSQAQAALGKSKAV